MVACGPVRIVRTVLLICAAGCASRRSGAPAGAAPAGAPPAPHESLRVTVTYPAATDVIQAHDSSFLFGMVRGGAGPAGLSVNGTPVPVLASGAWIVWVPLPDDTIVSFRLVGHAGADSVVSVYAARVAPRFHPPAARAAWIDTTSFAPTGMLALPANEGIRLAVRAAPGATVRLRLPWGAVIPFVPDTLPAEPAWGVRAFTTDPAAHRLPAEPDRYVAWLPAAAMCGDGVTGCATLQLAAGPDTATARWPLS